MLPLCIHCPFVRVVYQDFIRNRSYAMHQVLIIIMYMNSASKSCKNKGKSSVSEGFISCSIAKVILGHAVRRQHMATCGS